MLSGGSPPDIRQAAGPLRTANEEVDFAGADHVDPMNIWRFKELKSWSSHQKCHRKNRVILKFGLNQQEEMGKLASQQPK